MIGRGNSSKEQLLQADNNMLLLFNKSFQDKVDLSLGKNELYRKKSSHSLDF